MKDHRVILYVEDDKASREVMYLMLVAEMGLSNVYIFEDSHDFLPRVTQLHPLPDIILLDIHVQPLDGFEMLRLLRAHPRYQAVPIVALTASVMNEEVDRLRQSGFDGVIAKPIDTDTFPRLLNRILGGEKVWRVAV